MTVIALGISGMKPVSVSAANGEPGQNGYFLIDEDGKEYWVEEDFESEINTEESVSLNSEADNKIKLPAPTGVTWDGWKCKWNPVPEGKGHYFIYIYMNGGQYKTVMYSAGKADTGRVNFSHYISESGTYKFHMTTTNSYDPDIYESSDLSKFSEEKVYVRPSQALETTIGWWDETTPGLFHWNPVENAGGYYVELLRFDEGKEDYKWAAGQNRYSSGFLEVDFSDDIARNGAGKYVVKVRALSDDIDTIANGEWGEASEVFDTSVNATTISDAISEALKNSGNNAEQALNELKGKEKKEK